MIDMDLGVQSAAWPYPVNPVNPVRFFDFDKLSTLDSMMPQKKKKNSKTVETLTHDEASRKNIPTAEYQSVIYKEEQSPKSHN